MSDMFEDAKAPGAGSPDDQGPGLGLDLPAAAAAQDKTKPAAPYTVLARKYRPQHFGDLIGQEAMVRTLGNAFSTARVHQAYIFTGVRGVGKTTAVQRATHCAPACQLARVRLAARDQRITDRADRVAFAQVERLAAAERFADRREIAQCQLHASHSANDR